MKSALLSSKSINCHLAASQQCAHQIQRPDQCSDDRHDLTSSGLTDIVAPHQSELTPFSSVRSFFRDTRYFWLGCTQFPPCNYKVSRGLRLLYAMELGYYLQASSLRSAP